ncbi:hypothetical protein JIN85_12850 [Luteolibacter pohnpeiensis]|uniref:Porin n=1 Tax=Luteolibacter pohnpeiensis TaxID=454153 RepID=A0A934SDN2_9BACT|nr:TorF family putative porin [Luteolibacter pohnpeiensis]MBK1883308.1 hypothetical protein [Luteolibacter pohnpeiensis]
MRNYSKTIVALAAASGLAAGSASAIDLDYNLHAGYTSEYLFRGLNLGQDLTEVGGDVSTEMYGLDLSAGFWQASFDAPMGGDHLNELDLYGSVAKDFDFVTASVGYIWYYNYDDIDDAQEVVFALSHDFGFVEASLSYFLDVETDNDGYSEFALSKGFDLTSCLTLNVSSALGYYVEPNDFAHVTTKVALDYKFAESATISPFIAASISLSDKDYTLNSGAKNQLVGGMMVSVDF